MTEQGMNESEQKIKDEEKAIISGRYQEMASEFSVFSVLREKTDEGQSEMDGRSGRKKDQLWWER